MNEAKASWLFSGVIDPGNVILPRDPFQLGLFEIATQLDPFPGVGEKLLESLTSFGYDTSRPYLRMTTSLVDSTRAEAQREGTLYAREALALFRNSNVFVENLRLLDAGYLVRLDDLQVFPVLRSMRSGLIGTLAMFDDVVTHPSYILNLLMRMPRERFGELGAAIRRSAHWADLATHTEDLGERLFMKWVAIECLARINPDESIGRKVAAAARFPSGRYEQGLPANERAELTALANYRAWRRRVTDLIDKLRDLRNAIAHSGFRELDVRSSLSENEIYLAQRLLTFAYAGVQGLALTGLELGITTIAAMWDRYAECLLPRRHISIAQELKGTIIFTFENPAEID